MEIEDILLFQIHRRFMSAGKDILSILEKNHEYIKSLEKTLITMGINVEKYENSEFSYTKDRSKVLGIMNDASRELQDLSKNFNINLKK